MELVAWLMLFAVFAMAVMLTVHNFRQARALERMENVLMDWYALQVRRDRKAVAETLSFTPEAAAAWLGKVVGEEDVAVEQKYDDYRAVEVVKEGRSWIVTSLPPDQFRRLLKAAKKGGNKLDVAVAPVAKRLLFDVGFTPDSEYFDLEAAAAGKALGISWGEPARLWVWQG